MTKVITYGTYDLLHYGHIRLLERAKSLGDYLIVGVTSDDYDRSRGKINNRQPLMERIQAIQNTGLADEVIVEEYDGQKIDDIRRLGVDVFAIGSDWEGQFDYLQEYCRVIYLPRTLGISSSLLRSASRKLRLGILGVTPFLSKFINECRYVNGVEISCICLAGNQCTKNIENIPVAGNYDELLAHSDAVYVISQPNQHYADTLKALENGKHVLCESPLGLSSLECKTLFDVANSRKCILFEGLKTAYCTAFERLVLLAKTGKIGEIISVDAVCTSLRDDLTNLQDGYQIPWNSICEWGGIAMLPIFQLLGIEYERKIIASKFIDSARLMDAFTKIDFIYPHAVASVRVGKGVKSEGTLVISGTRGYVYVPAPWWKTDYYELRYEHLEDTQKHYYQLQGEGIRNEIVAFVKSIEQSSNWSNVSQGISSAIGGIIGDFYNRQDLCEIR